jgi:hypothetical protein
MRILHVTLWALVALACAAPTCDTHDASLGSGSGSSAWARMPSPSAAAPAQHQDVVHAMESITGASLDHTTSSTKPAKPTRSPNAGKHAGGDGDDSGGGNDGRSSSSPTPPPPKPELPETDRKVGQPCEEKEQCASDMCEYGACVKHFDDKLTKGEKCDYDRDCISNHCYQDACD